MKVGIIGIGTMGRPMAANILKAGHTLSVFARNPEKARALEAQGAKKGRLLRRNRFHRAAE